MRTTKMEAKRAEKRMSLAELARRARMAATDVGKIESGRLRPYPRQVQKIARALGVAVDELE